MKKLLLAALLLCGCGPSFSPELMLKCDDMMLPPSNGLNGPNPPQVGGAANPTKDMHWSGKIMLVSMPRTAMEHARVHPAMKALDKSLQAGSDAEVDAVGFVLQNSAPARGGPAGSGTGYMVVTLVDWKKQVNLGTVLVKSWKNNAPQPADFEAAYPELATKIKDLHK